MGNRETIRIAMVQALTDVQEPARNVDHALRYMEVASVQGAEIVCFPETYPGPWTPPLHHDPLPMLCEGAVEHGLYVVAGLIEPVGEEPERYYVSEVLIDSHGRIAGKYRRTTPPGPWIYQGGEFWDFFYQEAAQLPVFDTPWGKVGLALCSEVYVPEVCRILALQGAELIFLPAGTPKGDLWHTWRTLTFARAIENLCFTATCQNLFAPSDLGLTMICSPEDILVETTQEGVFVADCDLSRIRYLRASEDTRDFAGVRQCKPGIFRHWYRPELHGDLLADVGRAAGAGESTESGDLGGS
jgi:predicted amidohydrolase